MIIAWRTVGPFEENTYLVADERTREAVLIDPGAEPDTLVRMVQDAAVTPVAIWLTHAHIDHIGGIAGVRRTWPVPVYLHHKDRLIYDRGDVVAGMYGLPFEQPDPPDHEYTDGDTVTVGAHAFRVLHTPGHAPGHVIFHGDGVVFGGDLLFAGSIGRTDLPLADPAAMERSLARVMTLDDALAVYPGHGPSTTIGRERATNPFLTLSRASV